MTAVFTFRIGQTFHRPIRPDEDFSFVTIAGEDTAAGARRAELDAIFMVAGRCEMVTSSELIAAEL